MMDKRRNVTSKLGRSVNVNEPVKPEEREREREREGEKCMCDACISG